MLPEQGSIRLEAVVPLPYAEYRLLWWAAGALVTVQQVALSLRQADSQSAQGSADGLQARRSSVGCFSELPPGMTARWAATGLLAGLTGMRDALWPKGCGAGVAYLVAAAAAAFAAATAGLSLALGAGALSSAGGTLQCLSTVLGMADACGRVWAVAMQYAEHEQCTSRLQCLMLGSPATMLGAQCPIAQLSRPHHTKRQCGSRP